MLLSQVSLPEQTDAHQPVLTVNATDADSGRNKQVSYSMAANMIVDSFYINSSTGQYRYMMIHTSDIQSGKV